VYLKTEGSAGCIGFIGLGVMGGPMARHVAEAFPGRLLAFDIDPARLAGC
jgi:3-hydroxyisobutyrate dehydrogenase-like beta-hydroxyacid dehydrogenase